MKKILLLGNLNDIIKSLYNCLIHDFQVQLCFGELETIKSVCQIVHPDMIMVNQLEAEEMEASVMEWLKPLADTIPVLFVTVEERWNGYKEYWDNSSFEKVFRPITRAELTQKCYRLLQTEPVSPSSEATQEHKRVMIVDDSPLVLRSLKTLLNDRYIVSLATSGEQALSLISRKQPDLILLDYEMPGWDGKMTYEMLKAQEDTRSIPVIFLTSVSDREHIAAILETKPADYILKPPDQDRLIQSIENALSRSGL